MKNSKIVVQQRQQGLLNYLRVKGAADVNLLADYFQVTPATIRRDLNTLEAQKYVTRYFGGVKCILQPETEEVIPTDIADDKEMLRREIAKAAAVLIKEGDTVFINSSATASLVLEYLDNKTVTVITNNARALTMNRGSRTQLILTGGEVYGKKQSLVGRYTTDTLSQITANICILGVSGISVEDGITSRILQETTINQMMLERCSGEKIIVTEGSKIGVSHSFYSGGIHDISHLITDSTAAETCLQDLRDHGVIVTVV